MTQTSHGTAAFTLPTRPQGLAGLVVLVLILRLVILLGWRDGGRRTE